MLFEQDEPVLFVAAPAEGEDSSEAQPAVDAAERSPSACKIYEAQFMARVQESGIKTRDCGLSTRPICW